MMTELLSKIAIVIAAILLTAPPCLAQAELGARIDSYVADEMKRQQIPGVSLAILRNGKVEFLKSYGFSNVEHQVRVKPETVFQSGSMGKQFTAAAIMILVQDGKLSLDDKISKYLDDTPDSWKTITIRNLLTHTAGFGDYPADFDLRRDLTEDQYLDVIKKVPLSYQPGTRWDYSNLGYVTLGILIHKVTGKFYGDFLAERIFQPLGMKTARVISEADIVPNRAAGYRLVEGELKNQEWVSPSTNTTADGSLYLTILDLAKWDAALYTDQPLSKAARDEMWAPAKLNGGTKGYGLGWFTNSMHGRRTLFHGGAWQGFKSFIIRFPNDRLSIVFLANSWETQDFKFARGLASLFYPEFALSSVKPLADKEPETTALVKKVLLQLSRAQSDQTLFTPEAHSRLDLRDVGRPLQTLSLPVAIIHMSELVERRDENDLRVYRYMLTDIGTTLFCTVKLTRDGKIADLQIN